MTDYEMTVICAEALGLGYVRPCEENPRAVEVNTDPQESSWMIYCPLDEDGEAMGLVKRFGISVRQTDPDMWHAWIPLRPADGEGADLNRAIVECVAKLQSSSPSAAGDADNLKSNQGETK